MTASRMIFKGRPADSIPYVNVRLINEALAAKTSTRAFVYVQHALAEHGAYAGPVDGQYRDSFVTALEQAWGDNYGTSTYAPDPATGKVSTAFVKALLTDYLDGHNLLPVQAG